MVADVNLGGKINIEQTARTLPRSMTRARTVPRTYPQSDRAKDCDPGFYFKKTCLYGMQGRRRRLSCSQ